MTTILNSNICLNDGTIATLMHAESLTFCRATPLLLREYANMIDNGYNTGNYLSFDNTSSVLWLEVEGDPIGGICYTVRKEVSQVFIAFSFTSPQWRKRGVNTTVHYELEKIMRDKNLNNILSFVSINNTPRIKSCEKVGMFPTHYRMGKVLKGEI